MGTVGTAAVASSTPKILSQRFEVSATPDGCRWCGTDKRAHANMWVPSVSYHHWTAPTSAQRLARMKTRIAYERANAGA